MIEQEDSSPDVTAQNQIAKDDILLRAVVSRTSVYYKHKRNLNVLVVGGSGAGKSRAYAVVNICLLYTSRCV